MLWAAVCSVMTARWRKTSPAALHPKINHSRASSTKSQRASLSSRGEAKQSVSRTHRSLWRRHKDDYPEIAFQTHTSSWGGNHDRASLPRRNGSGFCGDRFNKKTTCSDGVFVCAERHHDG